MSAPTPAVATTTAARGTVRLTVAQAVLRFLVAQYSVRDGERSRLIPGLLAIYGHGNAAGFGEAMEALPDGELYFLEGRNEQAMAHAAAAFARATRRRATLACSASIGPGSTNMVTAAAGAFVNRLPVLLLVSDMYATRRQGPHLQGLEHPMHGDWSVNDAFRPVSRYFDRVSRPEQLLAALPAAMLALTSVSDPGPAVLSIPQDVQTEAFAFPADFFAPREWTLDRPVADPERLQEAAAAIRAAERPLILAGGGVRYSDAEHELRELAETLGVPVAETFAGKGVVADGTWRDLGGLGVEGTTPANAVARHADLIICAGTRLADFVTGSRSVFAPDAHFIGLNIARFDAVKEGAIPVVGDLRQSLRSLTGELAGHQTSDAYQREAAELVEDWRLATSAFVAEDTSRPLSQSDAIAVLNDHVRAGDVVTSAAGTGIGELLKFWDGSGERRVDLEMGYSCMGYEIPAALGNKLAHPDADAYAFVGDGTFLLYPSDLVVALQHGVKITVVISDNGGMQSIHRLASGVTDAPYANLFHPRDPQARRMRDDPLPIDLGVVAKGLGATVFYAATHAELREALEAARAVESVAVVVCKTDPNRKLARGEVWWDIAPAEVSESSHVSAARASYEEVRSERQPEHRGGGVFQ